MPLPVFFFDTWSFCTVFFVAANLSAFWTLVVKSSAGIAQLDTPAVFVTSGFSWKIFRFLISNIVHLLGALPAIQKAKKVVDVSANPLDAIWKVKNKMVIKWRLIFRYYEICRWTWRSVTFH